jgi:hypothetical protein
MQRDVSFVDRDRPRFDAERAVLHAGRAYAPNAMNLALLDALGRDFGGIYLAAVKAIAPAKAGSGGH